ncbi:Tryptophan synthase beta chain [Frankliniella fusca]|uniref:Tryptophan synthase beta chain n=1 Tax=Frankliniella fusca TaxID=407009 RepID=A0AAE1LD53_9NEOP|nr:Tryptophan synthase beta chain [Frankliniella fusca]
MISSPYQREELSYFTDNKVLIDSTHGTNSYDFQLTTVETVDSAGVGVPVGYCISNHVTKDFMKQYFRILKDNIKKASPSTKVFSPPFCFEKA